MTDVCMPRRFAGRTANRIFLKVRAARENMLFKNFENSLTKGCGCDTVKQIQKTGFLHGLSAFYSGIFLRILF